MFAKSVLASSLLLVAGVIAQSTTNGTSNQVEGSDGNMVSVQVVQVSDRNATLKFYPEEIKAEPGSMVQFQFYPNSHTVTQSTFANPCEPINKVMPNVTGINSGQLPPENGMMKVFTIMVNDTKPLWMYCATKDHCQKGMVMAINAPQSGEKTFASYKALAAKFDPANPNATANSANGTSGNATSPLPSAGSASSITNSILGTTGIGIFLIAASALLL